MSTTETRTQGLCHADDSLLLIVDVQEKLTAVMPDKVVNRLRRNAGMLLQTATAIGIPVIATEQYPKGLGKLEEALTSLLPQGSSLYEKTGFSCLAAEGLTERLADSGRRQVILSGVEAHICVLQSALDLKARGYEVFVVGDAVCSRNRENYENSLQRLRHAAVNVVDAESVLFEWVRDSKHEHFKFVSGLVQAS